MANDTIADSDILPGVLDETDVNARVVETLDDLKSKLATVPLAISGIDLDFKPFDVRDMKLVEVLERIKGLLLKWHNKQDLIVKVPSVTKDNAKFVPQLNRFVLGSFAEHIYSPSSSAYKYIVLSNVLHIIVKALCNGIVMTERGIFYTDRRLFKKQKITDYAVKDVCCILGCTRESLNIIGASSNGRVVGKLLCEFDGQLVDCSKIGGAGIYIPTNIHRVTRMVDIGAKFILVVGKDTFTSLSLDKFYEAIPCIIFTGNNRPDRASRIFLQKMRYELMLPVFGFVDCDPCGIRMFAEYKYGSKKMAFDNVRMSTPDMKWLGLLPSDLVKYKMAEEFSMEMTQEEHERLRKLLNEEFVKNDAKMADELNILFKSGKKTEIVALTCLGPHHLSVILKEKIASRDWV